MDISQDEKLRSLNSDIQIKLKFHNKSPWVVDLLWLDFKGERVHYNTLKRNEKTTMNTFATHPWLAIDRALGMEMLIDNGSHFVIPYTDGNRRQGQSIEIRLPVARLFYLCARRVKLLTGKSALKDLQGQLPQYILQLLDTSDIRWTSRYTPETGVRPL